MIDKIKSHIHFKISLTITVGAVTVAVIASTVFYLSSYNEESQRNRLIAKQLIDTVTQPASVALFLNNQEMIVEVAESLLVNDIIADVKISNQDQLFYNSETESLAPKGEKWIHSGIEDPFSPGTQVGTISYRLNNTLIENQARQIGLRNAGTLLMQSLLIAILTMALVYTKLTKHLLNMAHTLHEIKPGESKNRLPLIKSFQNDELGLLTSDINNLLDSTQIVISQKEELISNLEIALQEIKTLQGILPICMYCKEIRDDEGSWNRIEQYITEHSEAEFSHGICDKCMKEKYGDDDVE